MIKSAYLLLIIGFWGMCGCRPETSKSPEDRSEQQRLPNQFIRSRALESRPNTVAIEVEIPDDDLYLKKGKKFLFRDKDDVDSAIQALLSSSRKSKGTYEPDGEGELGIWLGLLDKNGNRLNGFNIIQGVVSSHWGPELHAWLEKRLGIPLK